MILCDLTRVFEKNIIIRLRLSYPDKFETRANWPARSQYITHTNPEETLSVFTNDEITCFT